MSGIVNTRDESSPQMPRAPLEGPALVNCWHGEPATISRRVSLVRDALICSKASCSSASNSHTSCAATTWGVG